MNYHICLFDGFIHVFAGVDSINFICVVAQYDDTMDLDSSEVCKIFTLFIFLHVYVVLH